MLCSTSLHTVTFAGESALQHLEGPCGWELGVSPIADGLLHGTPGRRLATGCGGMIRIINAVSGQVERKVEGCGGMAIAWLPSGWSLADCGDRLHLIDSVSGQVEREVHFPHPLRGVQDVPWHFAITKLSSNALLESIFLCQSAEGERKIYEKGTQASVA